MATWLVGSSRAPNRLVGLRIPLATARTFPWPWVRIVTMRSASPSLIVRKTTPWSRYKAMFLLRRRKLRLCEDDQRSRRPRAQSSYSGVIRGSPGSAVDGAEAPLPALVLPDRLEQVVAPEVRPQDVGEHQLGVGELPEEIVRDPELPRGPHEQVGVGHVRRVQASSDGAFADLVRVEPSRRHLVADDAGGVDQLGPPAVVEREREGHGAVAASELFRVGDLAAQPARDPSAPPADESHPDATVVELVAPAEQQVLVEVHEIPHLVDRSAPVLRRERVDRHPLEPDVESAFDGVEQGLLTGSMAFGPLQPALLGPAAIAVHDDGNVTRKVGALDPGGHDSNLHRGSPRSTGGRYDRPPCAGPPS